MATPHLTLSHWPRDLSHPVHETTVGARLREAAAAVPETVALIEGAADRAARRRWTYAELLTEAEQVAQGLLAHFSPGEHVAIWSPNCPEWIILEYAAALAGLTLVTVNPSYKAAEVAYVLRQSRSAGVVLAPEYRGVSLVDTLDSIRSELAGLREVIPLTHWADLRASGSPSQALPEVFPSDAAQIQYTSGTTGFPKGALLHHRGLTNNALHFAERFGARPGDVWVNCMPLFHTAGCVMLTLGPLQTFGTEVVVPGFDPGLVLELCETEGGTFTCGVPTMLLSLLAHPDLARRDLSSVRALGVGGAPVPADLVRRVEAAFDAPLATVYAQTEASPVITQTHTGGTQEDRTTCGTPLPQTEVKIVDPATREIVPVGKVGEICARGYQVMHGYFDMPEATAQAIDPKGWLHTGDLGTMNACGYVQVTGRLKDMIIRGGDNIYPREIEDVLIAHQGVADVAVVGVPDTYWGEQPAAFIRPATDPPPSEDELRAYARRYLASYKVPRHWVFLAQFPQTPSGKVQKFVLRERFIGGTTLEPRIAGDR